MNDTPLLLITALAASVLGLLYFRLSMAIIRVRHSEKISIGDGDDESLTRSIRVHSNFAEYVPLSLVLLAILELNGGPGFILIVLAATLVFGRFLHAKGLIDDSRNSFKLRKLGMQLTLCTLIALCAFNILLVLYRLF